MRRPSIHRLTGQAHHCLRGGKEVRYARCHQDGEGRDSSSIHTDAGGGCSGHHVPAPEEDEGAGSRGVIFPPLSSS